MKHAFVLGGTGQIGFAVATRLLAEGWHVTLASRTPSATATGHPGLRNVAVDLKMPGAVASALGNGADLLVDCIAFDSADAAQLVEV